MKFGLLIVLVLCCSSLACSQDNNTVSPDRPSFSTSAHIVPPGRIQVEAGASQQRFGDTSGYDAGELRVRYGLFSRVEFRAQLPNYVVTETNGERLSGWDDSAVGTKILLKSGDKGAASLMVNAILPTGSTSIAERAFQPGATLISDVNLSKKFVVTTNVGYFRMSSDGQPYNLTFAVSTLNYALARSVNIYSEFYIKNVVHGARLRYAATGGEWTVRKRTAFDWSVGFGLDNHAHGPDRYFGIGISRLF
jgi:hypothetical protein